MTVRPERAQTVLADLEAKFDRHDVVYKTVGDTPIGAAIFIPKAFASSKESATAPVLVHFHGGGLVTGDFPEPYFLADWVLELAHSTNAIFISAGYRMAPETPAVTILTEDIADFWAWLHAHLPAAIGTTHPHLAPDLARLAAVGESAGGYLALQSAFVLNGAARLRAAIAQYPSLYTDLPDFNARPANPDPALDAYVAEYLAAVRPGAARVSTPWPTGLQLAGAGLAAGALRTLFGPDPEGKLTLAYALREGGAAAVPPAVWVVQGSEDAMVARAAADELVERLRAARPRANVKYTVRPGDHGFDAENKLEDDWVKEGVEFVKGFWLE